jgi:hypothetical protein
MSTLHVRDKRYKRDKSLYVALFPLFLLIPRNEEGAM